MCASNRPLPPPLSEDFSLTDSSDSVAEIRDVRDSKDAQTKLIGHPFKDPVYVLYVGDSNIRTMSEAEFDREQLTEYISRLPRAGQIVAVRLVELLEAAASVETKFRIENVAPSFQIPRTHVDDATWQDWANEYNF